MTLTVCLPSSQRAMAGSATAAATASFSEDPLGSLTSARTFPETCTATVATSSTASFGSKAGQPETRRLSLPPSFSFSSSLRCGAMGCRSATSARSVAAVSPGSAFASPTRAAACVPNSMRCATAVWKENASKSSVTLLTAMCRARAAGVSAAAGSPRTSAPDATKRSTTVRTRPRKRSGPLMPSSLHSASFSGGPRKRTNARTASAPFSAMSGSRDTALPRDFDIFSTRPVGDWRVIIPWLNSAENGSSNATRPRSFITRAKKRA